MNGKIIHGVSTVFDNRSSNPCTDRLPLNWDTGARKNEDGGASGGVSESDPTVRNPLQYQSMFEARSPMFNNSGYAAYQQKTA